jgi:hypothetical protein
MLQSFTGIDTKFNPESVTLDLNQGKYNLGEIGKPLLADFLGPYAWRIVGHMRAKLRGTPEFETELNELLKSEQITDESFHKFVTFQNLGQLERVFVKPEDSLMHQRHTRNVLQNLIGGVFSYREFVTSRIKSSQGTFNPHKHFQKGNPDRFIWPTQFGSLQEIWLYDLLNYYFRITQKDYNARISKWSADLKLGIDMTIGGIPTDITISSELPDGIKKPDADTKYRINSKKIKKVKGKYIAILRPDTWFTSAYSTLQREALLSAYPGLGTWQMRYGLRRLPEGFFQYNGRVDLVHRAIAEIVRETQQYVLPYMQVGDPSKLATERLLREILSG